MFTYTNSAPLSEEHAACCAVLGNFDGVHLGHQEIIKQMVADAKRSNRSSMVIAFEPHPRQFFRAEESPFRLTSLNIKSRILDRLGVDVLYCLRFDAELSRLPAEQFVEDILDRQLKLAHLTVGYDFRFGAGRTGDTALLEKMSATQGYGLTVVDPITDAASDAPVVYSSSNIRAALREGEVLKANEWLGRAWCIDGCVEKGDQRGRTIGFPTLNVPIGDYLRPALGVYAVKVEIDGQEPRDGVANLGMRPTFDKSDILLEAHIFDFDEEIYGAQVVVHFVDFIRGERKFDGIESLKSQIQQDSETARRLLGAGNLPTLV